MSDQRLVALRKANDVRTRRAHLYRDLREGKVTIWKVLDTTPEWLASAQIQAVLIATPTLGRKKVARLLADLRISPSRQIGALTDRELGRLVNAIRSEYPATIRRAA